MIIINIMVKGILYYVLSIIHIRMYRFYIYMHYSIVFILSQRLLKAQNIYIESFFTQVTLLKFPITYIS